MAWGVAASFVDFPGFDVPLALPLTLGTMVVMMGGMWVRDEPSEIFHHQQVSAAFGCGDPGGQHSNQRCYESRKTVACFQSYL